MVNKNKSKDGCYGLLARIEEKVRILRIMRTFKICLREALVKLWRNERTAHGGQDEMIAPLWTPTNVSWVNFHGMISNHYFCLL